MEKRTRLVKCNGCGKGWIREGKYCQVCLEKFVSLDQQKKVKINEQKNNTEVTIWRTVFDFFDLLN